jgi:O-antigen ligase
LSYRLSGIFSTGMTAGNVYMTAFVVSIAAWLVLHKKQRLMALTSTVLAGAALLATFTRSSWLGGLVGVGGMLLVRRRWLILAGLAVALGLTVTTVPAIRDRAMSAADGSHNTVQGRLSLWQSGFELFAQKPITGWGLADHSDLIRSSRRADATFEAGHFHSNPVQIAVATGGLGLLAYAFFNLAIGWVMWGKRKSSPWAVAGLGVWLAFHVAGFFDWSFGDAEVAYQYFFWMGVGIAAAQAGPVR